jgi:hypothetical protein
LVVHSYLTPIPLLSTWTNKMRDSGESVVGPNFFNNIIGPSRRRWDRSEMRVYNQAFLFFYAFFLSESGDRFILIGASFELNRCFFFAFATASCSP